MPMNDKSEWLLLSQCSTLQIATSNSSAAVHFYLGAVRSDRESSAVAIVSSVGCSKETERDWQVGSRQVTYTPQYYRCAQYTGQERTSNMVLASTSSSELVLTQEEIRVLNSACRLRMSTMLAT